MRRALVIVVAGLVGFCAPRGACATSAISDRQLASLGFDQKLNAQASLALPFVDEAGNSVALGRYFQNKPVILVLGYYECPMLCTLVLNGMIEGLQDIRWSIGDQFEVVNISIDPNEGPALAAAKKAVYLKRYGRKNAAGGWHFLTGKPDAIARIADEVGFRFLYDPKSKQFAHPSGLVVLTPQGKVAGYQFGVAFQGTQLLAALRQANSGQAGSPVQKLVLLCFHYNPITGKYGPAIMIGVRLLGLLTIAALGWTVWRFARAGPDPAEREPARAATSTPLKGNEPEENGNSPPQQSAKSGRAPGGAA